MPPPFVYVESLSAIASANTYKYIVNVIGTNVNSMIALSVTLLPIRLSIFFLFSSLAHIQFTMLQSLRL